MSARKPYTELLKETLTKTLGQRYSESSHRDKIVYWIFIAIVTSFISGGWLYGTLVHP